MGKPLVGHGRGCDCDRCERRRKKANKISAAWAKRKREERKAMRDAEIAAYSALLKKCGGGVFGRMEEYFINHKTELTEINGVIEASDIRAQYKRQKGKCFMTDRAIKLNGDWKHVNAPLVVRNDCLSPWAPDNIRIVTIYAERYVIDPGNSRPLDDYKVERLKPWGLE